MSWKFGFSNWKSHWCPLKMSTNFHKSQLFQLRCGNFPARHSDTTAPCGPCSLAHLSQMHWTWGQLLHSWRTVPGCSWKHALERGMRSATEPSKNGDILWTLWNPAPVGIWFIPQSHYLQCFTVCWISPNKCNSTWFKQQKWGYNWDFPKKNWDWTLTFTIL